MANQGWQIEWMSSIVICFYASNDHDYYTVEFNENQGFTNDEVDVPGHQLKHYEELDYRFICSTKYFSIYHSLQNKNFSIEEDLQKRYFLEVRKKWIVFSIALLLFLSLFLSLVLFQSIKMLFLSSNLFIALFFEYLFYILTIIFLRFKRYSSIKQILLRTYFMALLSFYCNLSYHVAGSQKIFG